MKKRRVSQCKDNKQTDRDEDFETRVVDHMRALSPLSSRTLETKLTGLEDGHCPEQDPYRTAIKRVLLAREAAAE